MAIIYPMTDQPLEWDRFFMLLAIGIGNSLVAQGIGLLVGAAANIQVMSSFIFLFLSILFFHF
jgi:hypothetical protein